MKISMFSLEKPLLLDLNFIQILEVENQTLFRSIIFSMNQLVQGHLGTEQIILEDQDAILDISKHVFLVMDVFNMDFNRSQILKTLYMYIEKHCLMEDELHQSIQQVSRNINQIMQQIVQEYEFELEFKSQYYIQDFLKLAGLKFNMQIYNTPFENLCGIMDVIASLNLFKVLVLVNCKCYFSESELAELYKTAIYKKIYLVLIESNLDLHLKHLE